MKANIAMERLIPYFSTDRYSKMLLALGYRDEETDWLFKLKKVRKPLIEFTKRIR